MCLKRREELFMSFMGFTKIRAEPGPSSIEDLLSPTGFSRLSAAAGIMANGSWKSQFMAMIHRRRRGRRLHGSRQSGSRWEHDLPPPQPNLLSGRDGDRPVFERGCL